MKYSKKVFLIRKHLGYSQEYMAIQLNVSQATYNRMERNIKNIKLEQLEQICEILGVEMPLLLSTDDLNHLIVHLPK